MSVRAVTPYVQAHGLVLPDSLGVDALKGELASVEPWEREYASPLELLRAMRPATVAGSSPVTDTDPGGGNALSSTAAGVRVPSSNKSGVTGGNRDAAEPTKE